MLRLGRSRLDVAVETVTLIDSLQMAAADRERVADRCRACAETQIVVTHGTDTMTHRIEPATGDISTQPSTAAAIAARRLNKTIVLTGAMIPYAFGSSDGLFNLGSALSLVQVLPPGVYVAMNGLVCDWDRCVKDIDGRFRTR